MYNISSILQNTDTADWLIFKIHNSLILWAIGLFTLSIAILALFASKKQNNLKPVPLLSVELFEPSRDNNNYIFKLLNHNEKFAYEIEFEKMYVKDVDSGKLSTFTLKIDGHNYIYDDIALSLYENDIKILGDNSFILYRLGNFITFKRGLILTFKDSQNNKYFTKLYFKKGSTIILKSSTKIGIFWFIWLFFRKIKDVFTVFLWKLNQKAKITAVE